MEEMLWSPVQNDQEVNCCMTHCDLVEVGFDDCWGTHVHDEMIHEPSSVTLHEEELSYPHVDDSLIADAVKIKTFQLEDGVTKPNFQPVRFMSRYTILTLGLLFAVANSAFVEVPNNTVVLKLESAEATAMACKSDCKCNLKWFVNEHHGSERKSLYDGYILRSHAKSYCTVIEDEAGKYHLNLTNKPDAAQTYICFEPETLHEASADLIWLGDLDFKDNSTEDLINLTCSINYRGNWAPMMEWKEHNSRVETVLTDGVKTTTVPNQRVTSTLVMPVQKGSRNYTCTTKFDISGKPSETTATNVPGHSVAWTSPAFFQSEDEIATPSVIPNEKMVAIVISIIIVIVTGAVLLVFFFIRRRRRRSSLEKLHRSFLQGQPKVPH